MADPRWPAYLYASDLGHPPANNMNFNVWRVINAEAASFIDRYARPGAGGLPPAVFQEQVVTCDGSAGSVFASDMLSQIAPGRVTLGSSESGHVTASAPTDSAAGTASDPLAFYIGNGAKGGCIMLPGAPPANGAMTSWTFPVCSGFTLLGEPALTLHASTAGTDAEINSRLWDEAPDGSLTLVSRGMYRWRGAAGPVSISYALIGGGWTFAAGHQVRIEVTQNDAPYMRLDNYPSAITYSSMSLTLPSRAGTGC